MKINGSLVFDASSASEIQNLRVEKLTGALVPTWTSADTGRLIYITVSGNGYVAGQFYYGTNTAWVAIATGGNAFSQAEGDAIEASLGAAINTNGTFNAAGFTNTAALTNPTSFTNAIQQVANYATANDTLFELDDVTLSAAVPTGAKFLYTPGGANWVDHTLVLADVSNVLTTAAELNELNTAGAVLADFVKLHAITTSAAQINNATATTASTTELNYVDGVTSPIQTQLDGKQALDAGLTALAAFNTNGIIVQTADNTYAGRTLVAPAAGVTITNPDGVAGNPTFALANDLGAVEALSGAGYAVRTAADTWVLRTIGGNAGRIVVTNGDGVATNTDVDLATVTDGGTGTFLKFSRDTYGRVTGTTAVVTSDITALVDATYVNVAGDTMSANASLVFSGTGTVTGLPAPVGDTDAANKAYVDALSAGLTWKTAVDVATVTNGALATAFANGQVVDGVTLTTGMRILVKNQTTASENGIYVVQASGAPVRATDMDAPAEFDGSAVFVKGGTVNESSGWTETATVTTVGTSAVVFSQFTGGALYTWGVGLSDSGNTININLGAGIAQLPSDEVGIDLFNTATGALILTDNGTTRAVAPATNSTLHLLLDSTATGGLDQGALGLFIKAAGVTNAMLVNPTFTVNADSGTPDPVALGETLVFAGTVAQGITTAVSGNQITISAANATTASKGVASFSSADFVVTAGVVTIGSLSNAQLDNSSITFAGTSGSDAVALGETLTFSSTVSGLVSSTVATNGVALDVRLATASLTGVASFNADHFTVAAGAVSLTATLSDLTDVGAGTDTAAANDLLSYVGGEWTNVTRAAVVGSTSVADHNDVTVTTPANGEVLSYTAGQWVNKKIFHVETIAVAATTWTVVHALGTRYCNVTVVDNTDNVVIPQSIVFDSTTQLTVTFNTAITGKVVVMGVA